jgi:hypothetical protein
VALVLGVVLAPSAMSLLGVVSVPLAALVLTVVLLLGEVWALLVALTRGVVSAPSAGASAASPPPRRHLSSRP